MAAVHAKMTTTEQSDVSISSYRKEPELVGKQRVAADEGDDDQERCYLELPVTTSTTKPNCREDKSSAWTFQQQLSFFYG
uniref:Uncharacterized protein n=1 Tax=Oryza sativa subsp. indica TaxID=39946 RepID=A0A679BBI8_ORYSI|nr:hypothetical protein [Oryza sativa Indica Group]BBD82432.1 hypothetical protein [Oryza sativa Indica Group]